MQFAGRGNASPAIGLRRVATAVRSREELEEQLRRILRFSAIMGAALNLSLVTAASAIRYADFQKNLLGTLLAPPYLIFPAIVGVSEVVCALMLGPRRQLGLRRLRLMEWVLVAPSVLFFVGIFTLNLPYLLSLNPDLAYVIALANSAPMATTMIIYAVFIPNTMRRVIGAIVLLAISAFIPDIILFLRHAAPPGSMVWMYLTAKVGFLVALAALAFYGAYRIDVLQQDAAEARKVGQYLLKQQLGQGGMGEVFLAEHALLRRPCAVKLIRPTGNSDPSIAARFEREVQTTANLTHPNTVQVYDYGRTDDGTFFYAMEYLPGISLEEMVEQKGALSSARAVHFLVQICGALREAHSLGLIHRDIKPSNVIVCERGGVGDVAKLLDFGLVVTRKVEANDPKLTEAGLLVGTPAFMSPEQCGGSEELTAASDIYSVGALGYYLLTGKSVFSGRTAMQMLAAHLYEAPKSLRESNGAIPPGIEQIILKCLAKAPDDRFRDVGELETALRSESVLLAEP